MSEATRPFGRYPDAGRRLLGRPRQGDLTARHGYGPPVFAICGFACAYCGFEMSGSYEDWLQLSVDHVVPSGSRSKGYPPAWLDDIANLVTCCRPCNEFSNAYAVNEAVPIDEAAFFDLRDRVFDEKRTLVLAKQAVERAWYETNVVAARQPVGPDPADPTP